jgi:DNA-binding NarL/FixJ family response regulator
MATRAFKPVIRIVIAEDQAPVRRGATLLLSMQPDMEVVGQARNGVEAVDLAELLQPDVVLMDLHMPLKGGVAATREITDARPGTQILVLTTVDDDEAVFEAVRAGAQTHLLKDASEEELLETIRALRRGESRMTPQIARRVMNQFRRLATARADSQGTASAAAAGSATVPAGHPSAEPLSDQEERLLELLAAGKTNRQIATTLALAEGTVRNYIGQIVQKLHADTRTELARVCTRQPESG